MLIPKYHNTELTPQHLFLSPSDRFREENKTKQISNLFFYNRSPAFIVEQRHLLIMFMVILINCINN